MRDRPAFEAWWVDKGVFLDSHWEIAETAWNDATERAARVADALGVEVQPDSSDPRYSGMDVAAREIAAKIREG